MEVGQRFALLRRSDLIVDVGVTRPAAPRFSWAATMALIAEPRIAKFLVFPMRSAPSALRSGVPNVQGHTQEIRKLLKGSGP